MYMHISVGNNYRYMYIYVYVYIYIYIYIYIPCLDDFSTTNHIPIYVDMGVDDKVHVGHSTHCMHGSNVVAIADAVDDAIVRPQLYE